ncbi:hypothetical protein SVIOM342S_09428 [Streptomyces violaceorubidus]
MWSRAGPGSPYILRPLCQGRSGPRPRPRQTAVRACPCAPWPVASCRSVDDPALRWRTPPAGTARPPGSSAGPGAPVRRAGPGRNRRREVLGALLQRCQPRHRDSVLDGLVARATRNLGRGARRCHGGLDLLRPGEDRLPQRGRTGRGAASGSVLRTASGRLDPHQTGGTSPLCRHAVTPVPASTSRRRADIAPLGRHRRDRRPRPVCAPPHAPRGRAPLVGGGMVGCRPPPCWPAFAGRPRSRVWAACRPGPRPRSPRCGARDSRAGRVDARYATADLVVHLHAAT